MNFLSTAIIFAGLFTSRPLVDPLPIAVESSRNPDQVVAATISAISNAGWKAEAIDRRSVRATFNRGPHVAIVLLRLDRNLISMKYESSVNLAYQKSGSGAVIHKAYMEWAGALRTSIQRGLSSLCPDMSELMNPSHIGVVRTALVETVPTLDSFEKELAVKSSSGTPTGYVVREYNAFLAGDSKGCEPVSTVYYNEKLVSLVRARMEPTALLAYTDILNYLVANKQIAFSDAEMERMSLKVEVVTPLDPPRREELLRFVEWQAQRFDRKETTQKEYEYLLAQKEAEVQERQGAINQKERELGLLRNQQAMQTASLDVQRQQLAAQRSLAIGQALENLSRSLSYRPAVIPTTYCRSSAIGTTVYTTCN